MYQKLLLSEKYSNKQDLLNAGIQVLGNFGAAKLSVRAIAERSGVSSSLFTYKFKSRENYLIELFEYMGALDTELVGRRERELLSVSGTHSLASLMFTTLYDEFVLNGALEKAFFEIELDRNFHEIIKPLVKLRHVNRVAFWEKGIAGTCGQNDIADALACQLRSVGRILLFENFAPRTIGWVWDILNRISERLAHSSLSTTEDSTWRRSFEKVTQLDLDLPDKNSTKGKILATALDIIEKEGSGALTHRTISKVSGISLSSLTHHYKSLNDILFHCYQSTYIDTRNQALERAPSRNSIRFGKIDELADIAFNLSVKANEIPSVMEEISRITARNEKTQNISIAFIALQGAASQHLLKQTAGVVDKTDRLDGHLFSHLFSSLSILRYQDQVQNKQLKKSIDHYLEALFSSPD